MESVCVCCGRYGETEHHHVGGRLYSDITTPVCLGCHGVLSAWQSERAWPVGRRIDRVIVGTLDILRLMTLVEPDTTSSPLNTAENIIGLIGESGVFVHRPMSYELDIPIAAPDDMQEYNRLLAFLTLFKDVAQTVLSRQPASPTLVEILHMVQRLDVQRVYRELSSKGAFDLLSYLRANLETIIGPVSSGSRLATNTGMPSSVRMEVAEQMTSDLRTMLSGMTEWKGSTIGSAGLDAGTPLKSSITAEGWTGRREPDDQVPDRNGLNAKDEA